MLLLRGTSTQKEKERSSTLRLSFVGPDAGRSNITYWATLSAYLLTCSGLQVVRAATAAVEEAMSGALPSSCQRRCYSTLWPAYLRALVRLQRLGSDAVSSAEIEVALRKGSRL